MRRAAAGLVGLGAAVALSACDPVIQLTSSPVGFDAPPAPAVTAPATCTAPGPANAVSAFSDTIGGRFRTWRVYTPPAVCTRSGGNFVRTPIVVAMHGAFESAASFVDDSRFAALAASQNIFVIFPDAYFGSWNDGRAGVDAPAFNEDVDDVAFVVSIVDRLVSDSAGDGRRTYAMGFSNGAMMANRLACDRGDRFAAVGLVAGFGPGNPAIGSICQPDRAMPVVVIASSNDPIVPYNGGYISTLSCVGGGAVDCGRGVSTSAADLLNLWNTRNGCGNASAPTAITATFGGGQRTTYSGCGAALEHDRLTDTVHEYYKRPGASEQIYDPTARVWNFFNGKIR
ncbi:MAG: PHB depolymerase family esterase [Acidimicrobiia bacterium]